MVLGLTIPACISVSLNAGEEGDGREGDCLTLIWIGRSIWTWGKVGEEGWIMRCDELGQTQRRRYGSKKTDYDMSPRLLHLSECHSLTFGAHRDFRQELHLPCRPLLLEEGRIQSVQNLPSVPGTEIAIENESETPTKM